MRGGGEENATFLLKLTKLRIQKSFSCIVVEPRFNVCCKDVRKNGYGKTMNAGKHRICCNCIGTIELKRGMQERKRNMRERCIDVLLYYVIHRET